MNDLKEQKRWVVWNREKRDGKDTKVPYFSPSRRASSTDPSTWMTYDEAKKASQVFDGIGIVFTPDETLVGIDIDHVFDGKKIIGDQAKEIEELIKSSNTYTEISPSGDGLHLYLQLESPLKLEANRRAPYEAYTSGRFFTWTENSYHKKPKLIRKVSVQECLSILKIIGYPWKKDEDASSSMAGGTSIFEDKELLERMFSSSNGDKTKALYDGDTSKTAGDQSRADASLLNTLAFWTRKDAAQMERLWLSSPLGKREKTQKRQDYRERSITNAIKNCAKIYRTQEERTFDEFGIDFLYTANKKGDKTVTLNTENICRILRYAPEFSGRLRYDTFRNVIEILSFDKAAAWRPLDDNDEIMVQTFISTRFDFFQKVTKQMTFDAMFCVAKENSYDSVIEYFLSLSWDRIPRLDTWLSSVYGVEDNEYHRAVASNWMKGLVKRLAVPGSKFDYVLVLEGEQGAKKSTSLFVLGEAFEHSLHAETVASTDNKDFFLQFSGKGIIEFSEGETLSRTEVKKMKAIITMQFDRLRLPFGRVSQDFPRRCVFAMTTNQDEYLKDETGNRRWLPVRVVKEEADIEWLEANRDQLFAEAYQRVITLGESTWEFPKEETAYQQDARRISDPNEERISHWYYYELSDLARQEGVTVLQAYKGALNEFGNSMKKYEEMSIADVFRRALKLERKRRMIDGIQQWRWVKENALDVILNEPSLVSEDELPDMS